MVEVHWRTGRIIPARLRYATTAVERLAQAGALGEDVAVLLQAATWFGDQADLAQLRGRMGRSSLVRRPHTEDAIDREACRRLARAYDAVGADAWNVLVDCIVWDSDLPTSRQPLLRAALYGLAQWLRGAQRKKPPDREGQGVKLG